MIGNICYQQKVRTNLFSKGAQNLLTMLTYTQGFMGTAEKHDTKDI